MLEREPERVLRDVRNELVSPAAAEREYGVVIDTEGWRVDEAATSRLRELRRSAASGRGTPFVTRNDRVSGRNC